MQIKETGLIDFVNSMLFHYHMVYRVYDTGMLLLVRCSSYRLSTLEVYLNNILQLLSQEDNQLIYLNTDGTFKCPEPAVFPLNSVGEKSCGRC